MYIHIIYIYIYHIILYHIYIYIYHIYHIYISLDIPYSHDFAPKAPHVDVLRDGAGRATGDAVIIFAARCGDRPPAKHG